MFSQRSPLNKELLAGVVLRSPDVIFDQEAKIDLGGVTARLLWFGGAHTKGDELTFVEPDRTLISGDVVQNQTMPNIFGDGGTPTSWLAVLDKVSRAQRRTCLARPQRSRRWFDGGGGMNLISGIRTRALALKRQGISADEAGKQISTDLSRSIPTGPTPTPPDRQALCGTAISQ